MKLRTNIRIAPKMYFRHLFLITAWLETVLLVFLFLQLFLLDVSFLITSSSFSSSFCAILVVLLRFRTIPCIYRKWCTPCINRPICDPHSDNFLLNHLQQDFHTACFICCNILHGIESARQTVGENAAKK